VGLPVEVLLREGEVEAVGLGDTEAVGVALGAQRSVLRA